MEIVHTDQAPAAVGPYSQAIVADNFVFCSGQIPLTTDGTLIEQGTAEQAEQILKNLSAVLIAAGSSLSKVVKSTIFLTDVNDFAVVNEVYARYFGEHKPARSTVVVAGLPKGAKLEIECIAKV